MSYNEDQVREIFFEEMREIFENVDRCILVLEKNPSDMDVIRNLFREVHTLKGSSGVFGLREICDLTHHAEDLLDRMRENKMVPTEEVFSVLLRCFDRLKDMMASAQARKNLGEFDNSELVQALVQFIKGGEGSHPAEAPAAVGGAAAAAPEAKSPPASNLIEYTITLKQCEKLFLMGMDPMTLILNCSDLASGPFKATATISNIPTLSELDAERCYTEFKLCFSSKSPEKDVRDIFEFVNDAVQLSIATNTPHQGQSPVAPQTQTAAPAPAAPAAAPVATAPGAPKPATPVATVVSPTPAAPAQPQVATPAPKPTVATVVTPPPAAASPAAAAPTAAAPTPVVANAPTAGAPAAPAAPKPAAPVAAAPAAAAAAAPGGAAGAGGDANDFVRIKKEKLDQLMNLVGELITAKNLFVHLANRLDGVLPGSELTKSFKEGTGHVTRLSSRLQESVMNARMVPVGTVFTKYTRLVRDVSKKLNKKVNLVIEGEDTELDKTVSEAISDPIMHLIRNAIDHGLEMPETRLERGKPEMGTILLKASYEGNNVKIIIKDDGNGIDTNRLKEKAVRLGITSAEQAETLSKKEIIDFIYHSGFSTAQEITDISGRGVGMDVVRNNIRKSSGSIFIDTEMGKGTEFRILLPLSLAVIDALLIGCGGETYALPQEQIIESVRAEPGDILNLNNQPSINLRDEVIPLLRLAELVPLRASVMDAFISRERNRMRHEESHQAGREWNGSLPIVIVQIDGLKVGILVDELYWQEQIMIKPLGGFLANIPIFSGACIMGNGAVVLVLEPKELYSLARLNDKAEGRKAAA